MTGERRGVQPEGTVTIEFVPLIDGDPDPGEVVWTRLPFEDDSEQGKNRPDVVIGRREVQVRVGTGAWDSRRRPSYARIWPDARPGC